MAITSVSAPHVGSGLYLLTWTSDAVEGTEFSIYRDGALLGQTTDREYLVTIAPGTAPVFEILEDGEAPTSPTSSTTKYPPHAILTWYAVADADHYLVEELVDGTWTRRATIDQDHRTYFAWQSRRLEDDATHQFRVIAVGTNGNEGTAVSLTLLMVRIPDAPDARFSYDAGTQTVTVTL